MTLYNSICLNMMLPANDVLFKTDIYNLFKFLEKSQWWTYEQLEDYQNKRVQLLIKHAYLTVPYYHNLLKSLHLFPEDIKTKNDLNKLPVLTKDIVRRDPQLFISKDTYKEDIIRRSTSGSSGTPFEYIIDRNIHVKLIKVKNIVMK